MQRLTRSLRQYGHVNNAPAQRLTRDKKPKARWVEPRVLVDVEYRAKTQKSRLLRHPSFKGVRRDLMDALKPTRRSRINGAVKAKTVR